jgi:HEAT repeat protein
VEAIVEALGRQKDPRAIPALRAAASRNYDPFLKLSIARSQLAVNDKQGYSTLISILKDDQAGFARFQAIELIKERAATDFGYSAEKSAVENGEALAKMEQWSKK